MASIRRQGKAWQAIVRKKGHKTLSKFFPKKVLAEAWARKTEEEISKKLYFNNRASEMTVVDMMTRYGREITPRKRSAETEKYRITTIISHLGSYTLENLVPAVILEFVDERLETVKSDSVRKELNVLSVAVDAAMGLWSIELPANPVHTTRNILKVTKTLSGSTRRSRRPSDEELQCLYRTLPNRMPLLVEFAIETAMRRGELVQQQVRHRSGHELRIPQTKTDKPRTIPLSRRACGILDTVGERENGSVWGYEQSSITHMFRRACQKCDIEDLRFHDLRHEAASRFFERDLNIAEVAKITGQSFEVLQRYTHLRAKDITKKLQ